MYKLNCVAVGCMGMYGYVCSFYAQWGMGLLHPKGTAVRRYPNTSTKFVTCHLPLLNDQPHTLHHFTLAHLQLIHSARERRALDHDCALLHWQGADACTCDIIERDVKDALWKFESRTGGHGVGVEVEG